MIPTTSQHGQGTWVLRVGPWRYLIFLGRVKPHSLPDHQVLSPSMAAVVMDLWLRDRRIDRYQQAALYWEFNSASTDLSGVGERQLEAWLVDAVAAGRLRICKFSRTVGGTPPSSSLGPPAASRTQADAPTPVYIGHEVAHKPANPLTNEPAKDVPVAVFKGTGYEPAKGLPDETDATCPSDNHRSESTATCSPAVNQWFVTKEVPEEFRDRSLGIKGGGGFVRSKTTVRHLPAGTPLYRYVNTPTKPWGGWWFLEPLDGNPCAMAALPADSSASVMVQSRLKMGIDVLYGPGAPRCSNKPGGPEQVLIALCDFHPSHNDVLDIVG